MEIAKRCRDGQLFILHGAEDPFAAQWLAKVLADAPDDRGANGEQAVIERASVRTGGLAGVVAKAYGATLLDVRRILLVTDFDVLTAAHKGKLTADDEAALALLLDERPSCPVVIATSGGRLDERRRHVKAMHGQPHFVMTDLSKPARSDLEWLAREWLLDCELTAEQLAALVDRSQGNLGVLWNESAKLALYAHDHRTLSDAELDLLVTDRSNGDLFAIVRMAAQGRWAEAYEEYRYFVAGQSVWPLLALLTRQFRLIARIYDAGSGASDAALAEALGVHPYACKVAREQTRFTAKRDCTLRLRELAELEFSVKSGRLQERTAMELWFLGCLCRSGG